MISYQQFLLGIKTYPLFNEYHTIVRARLQEVVYLYVVIGKFIFYYVEFF